MIRRSFGLYVDFKLNRSRTGGLRTCTIASRRMSRGRAIAPDPPIQMGFNVDGEQPGQCL